VRYLSQVGSRPGPQDLRASDADRDLVISLLSEAAGDGRLTLAEHAERSERALEARTLGELASLTSDLAMPSGQPIRLYPGRSVTALFARERRQGRWVVPDEFPVTTFLGDVVLDFRDAIWQSKRVVIHATAVAGQIKLIVPAGISVEMAGRSVLGVRSVRGRRAPAPPLGVIEVHTTTFAGSVKVTTVRPPRRRGRSGTRPPGR
jgi:Domain of unknown function (DUF1707)/Cell wall-active antibiotics response 4TMS YvqF